MTGDNEEILGASVLEAGIYPEGGGSCDFPFHVELPSNHSTYSISVGDWTEAYTPESVASPRITIANS